MNHARAHAHARACTRTKIPGVIPSPTWRLEFWGLAVGAWAAGGASAPPPWWSVLFGGLVNLLFLWPVGPIFCFFGRAAELSAKRPFSARFCCLVRGVALQTWVVVGCRQAEGGRAGSSCRHKCGETPQHFYRCSLLRPDESRPMKPGAVRKAEPAAGGRGQFAVNPRRGMAINSSVSPTARHPPNGGPGGVAGARRVQVGAAALVNSSPPASRPASVHRAFN